MPGNSILNNAKYSTDTDEWYTPYELIEEELSHYSRHFAGKIVLCNCDDPFESNFTRYFLRNFNKLKLKELICTSYVDSKISLLCGYKQLVLTDEKGEPITPNTGYVLSVSKIRGKQGRELDDNEVIKILNKKGVVKKLKGPGEFQSPECIEYLKKCDICCTNPPFSLFTNLFSLLVKYNKKYLLIGNQNAITYKEIFPYIKENKAWVGYRFGDMAFRVPNNTPPRETRFWIDEYGQKWRSLGNAMWLTNLDIPKRHVMLELTKTYSSELYPKYDNFDAINIKKVADIPKNFNGIMGVPITFLKYYNSSQFEIIGEANHGSDNEFDLFKPKVQGKELFKKILIKKKTVMPKFSNEFKVLDLFCGAGGLSYGIDKNPHFQTVVASDFDEKASLTFKNNIPYAKIVVGDITNSKIKKEIIDLSRKAGVNIIVGGPPCQGYSMKGKKLGLEDPRNFLFREYLNIVEILQPEIFVIENVKSILSTSKGWFKEQIVNAIQKLGYEVEYGVLNAVNFGVPQTRERAIFICSRLGKLTLPNSSNTKIITVRDAISDLAYLESGEGDYEQEYIINAQSKYQKEMRAGSKKLFNHKASNHAPIAIKKLKMIPPEKGKEYLPKDMLGKQKFHSTWGRLKWDEPSPTIDTRFDAASNGKNNHPILNRAITPREAARIQSFDDKFVFYGSKVYIRKQIGNAVPPLLAKAIAAHIFQETQKINNERSNDNK